MVVWAQTCQLVQDEVAVEMDQSGCHENEGGAGSPFSCVSQRETNMQNVPWEIECIGQ